MGEGERAREGETNDKYMHREGGVRQRRERGN